MKRRSARRLLALLLTLAMVLGLTPGAFALDGDDASDTVTWEQVSNDSVTAAIDQTVAEEPEEEPLYGDTEDVRVSIVLEEQPTLMRFSMAANEDVTANSSAMNYRAGLQEQQDAVAEAISEEALGGEKLDVVWNLTLVANAISANVAYGSIEDIKAVPGVADVVVERRYEPDVYSVGADDPNMQVSTGMTGTATAWTNGYTGAGMRVAIIDTGLDTAHQSFDSDAYLHAIDLDAQAAVTEDKAKSEEAYIASLDLLDAEEIAGKLKDLNIYKEDNSLTAADLYINAKIPFGYSYIDGDTDVTHLNDTQGEHGSHVAGIATANRFLDNGDGSFAEALDAVHMVGNAPDAQVIVMKVFGNAGGAYDSDYMAAIEDAVVLGCDSVNLSLGSGNPGMTYSTGYEEIMDMLTTTDMLSVMSAGNSGYWAENDSVIGYPYADEANFHTGGSPGTFTNSLGVASVDNDGKIGMSFSVGDINVYYNETSYKNEPMATLDTSADGTGTEYDYVFVTGVGVAGDYEGMDLTGKVVFCSRGTTSFFEKGDVAAEKGAAATVVCNNQPGTINMDLSGYGHTAPCVSITQAEAAAIKALSTVQQTAGGKTYYTGKVKITRNLGVQELDSKYLTMSSFSSWGVPGDLSIKPEITAPGGNIWSLNGAHKGDNAHEAHDAYELMGGTSMAAPQVAGIGALVKQYIEEEGLSQTGLTDRALAQSLLMSTATPLLTENDDKEEIYYSILQQGAGLVNTSAATSADSYILVDGQEDGKVKVELGDDPDRTGEYSFAFTVTNLDGAEHQYDLSADVFTQAVFAYYVNNEQDVGYYLDTLTAPMGAEAAFTGADVQGSRLTVAAKGTATVNVTITLDSGDVADLEEACPNGFYVEAFVKADAVATGEGVKGTSHSIPVLGFYGSWTDLSMFDVGSYAEYAYGMENRLPHLGNTKTNTLTVRYAGSSDTYYYGGNPFARDDEYLEKRNALNNENGDALYKWVFSAVRNAAAARLTIADIQGACAPIETDLGAVNGAYYHTNSAKWMGTSASLNLNWAGTDGNGDPLPEGTTVKLALTLAPELYVTGYDAGGKPQVDWAALGDGASLTTLVTIDNTAPEMLAATVEGQNLTVNAQDNQYVACVALFDATGTRALAFDTPNQTEQGVEAAVSLNLAGLAGRTFIVQVYDYAENVNTYRVTLGEELGVDIDSYYVALNQLDLKWYGMNGDGSELISIAAQDIYAAEYVAGYVFAFDNAADQAANLYAMPADDPGDVTLVGTMKNPSAEGHDFYVGDMAYSNMDQTMYFLYYVDDGMSYYPFLATVDIYTGETETIGRLGATVAGLTIDTDGNFYGIVKGDDYYLVQYTADTYDAPVQVGETPVAAGVEIPGWVSLAWDAAKGKIVMADSQAMYFVLGGEEHYMKDSLALREIDPETAEMQVILDEMPGIMRGLYVQEPVYDFDGDGDEDRDDAQALLDYATGLRTSLTNRELADLNWDGAVTSYDAYLYLLLLDSPTGFESTDVPTSVEVSPDSVELLVGSQEQLAASVGPWNLSDRSVTWSSSDVSVARVSRSGLVTAVGVGECVITAASVLDGSVYGTCAVSTYSISKDLTALVWDEQGEVWWTEFNTEAPSAFVRELASSENSLASAVMSGDAIYGATIDTDNEASTLFEVDPDTMEETKIADLTSGGAIFACDLADAPNLNPDGSGYLLGLYGYYVCIIDKDTGAIVGAWNYGESSTMLVAIAYCGSVLNTYYNDYIDTYAIIDSEGNVYYEAFMDMDGQNYYFNGMEEALLFNSGYSTGKTVFFNSAVYTTDDLGNPYLFWSQFDEESNEVNLIAMDIDVTGEVSCLGTFPEGVWPVGGLMAEDVPGLASDGLASVFEDAAIGDEAAFAAEPAVFDVPEGEEPVEDEEFAEGEEPVEDEEPVEGGEPMNGAALDLSFGVQMAAPLMSTAIIDTGYVSAAKKTVTVELTADCDTTNGLLEITYNPRLLTLVSADGEALLQSVNDDGNGRIIFGYAGRDAISEGEELATLVFSYHHAVLNTDITVTTLEDGDTNPGTEDTITLRSGSSGGITPPRPTEPEKPEKPEKPDVTEPEKPDVTEPEDTHDTTCPSRFFTDLSSSAWYHEYADYVIGEGLMTGASDTTFAPNAALTRAMLVTTLYRAEKEPAVTGADTFTDVVSGSWYEKAVIWAAANGIVTGYGDGRFGPGDPITRQQLAAILWRFAQYKGYDVRANGTTMPDFVDRGQIASWAGEAVSWAYSRGVLTGKDGNVLDPTGGATRMEAAAMLARFLQLPKSSDDLA